VARVDRKLLFAIMNLGWRFFLHHLARLSPFRTRHGIERFRENYVHEGLPPHTPSERAQGAEALRCTSCGFCDAVCPLLVDDSAPGFIGPRAFVLSAARAAPHFEDVRATLTTLTSSVCQGCGLCVAACPERIPILDIASMCTAQLVVIDDARTARNAIVKGGS
jgi:succinate dehydrogenase/fumarate reductase-like Fe-S protein